MNDIQTTLLDFFGFAWWVEISTDFPRCHYYFGPFDSAKDAEAAKQGYIEDLEQEGAQGMVVRVKCCKPSVLTIDAEYRNYRTVPSLGRWRGAS